MIRRGVEEEKGRREEEKGKGFMDWDLKIPSWDFPEFERETDPNIAPVVGSSTVGGQKTKGDCSVDLKLGRLGDFGDGSVDKWKDSRVSTMVSSPLGSSKRARAPSNGTQTVSCLVDGCNSDLTKCRDYHRRHKVCEAHSKTPKVLVGGQEQRFCQQCSRFHLLVEFDEVKRSCRKRLDGHNRRRRKPQPESLTMNSGSLYSNHQGSDSFTTTPRPRTNEWLPTLTRSRASSRLGNSLGGFGFLSEEERKKPYPLPLTCMEHPCRRFGPSARWVSSRKYSTSYRLGTRLLPFNNAQIFPSATVVSTTWASVVKTEEDSMIYNCHPSLHYVDRQNPFPGSFSNSYKGGGKQFPFLQVNDSALGNRTAPEASICQPLLSTIASSESGGTGRKMFSDGLTRVLDSDCALSLLSSPPTHTSGISLSHVVQPDSIPMTQPLVPGLQYNGIGRYQSQGMEGEPVSSVLVSNASEAELHCQGIFHVGPDGSSQNGVPQTLPFSWH